LYRHPHSACNLFMVVVVPEPSLIGTRLPHISTRLMAGVFFLCTIVCGCAVTAPQTASLQDSWPGDLPRRVELPGVPFFPQTDYQCGPASLATTLVHMGVDTTPDALVNLLYIPARRGSVQVEMLAAPRHFGAVSYVLEPTLEGMLREIAAGIPVVVLQDLGAGPFHRWHYAVAIGYDASSGTVVLRSGQQRRLVLPLAGFEYTWAASGHWAMATVPPARIPATADRDRYFEAIRAVEGAGHARAAAIAYEAFSVRWSDHLGGYI
jgi:Peptidase_C39 like family